jgi:hypothetical protein
MVAPHGPLFKRAEHALGLSLGLREVGAGQAMLGATAVSTGLPGGAE